MAIEIASNALLHQIVTRVSNAPVDFENLSREGDQNKDPNRIPGLYAERHVRHVLLDIARDDENLHVDPIKGGLYTRNLRFVTNPKVNDGLLVRYRDTGKKITEYDIRGIADGLVFIGEVKTANVKGKASKLRLARPTTEMIEMKLGPFQEFFGNNKFGFIVTGPHGVYSEVRQEQYREKGILVAEFPIEREVFRAEALKRA